MSEPIRGLLLDFGHTLVNYEADEGQLLESYQEIHAFLDGCGISQEPIPDDLMLRVFKRLSEVITASYLNNEMEELDAVAIYQDAFHHFGYALDRELLHTILGMDHRALASQFEVPVASLDALAELRRRGLRIAIVSNATPLAEVMRHDLEVLGIAPYVDASVYSSEVGVRKPHPKIYLSAVERLGLRPEACLFVGDRVREDIEGPRSLGIRGVLTREFRQEEVGVGQPVGVIERFAELPGLLGRLR